VVSYQALQRIFSEGIPPLKDPGRWSAAFQHFQELCFYREPEKRPSANELLRVRAASAALFGLLYLSLPSLFSWSAAHRWCGVAGGWRMADHSTHCSTTWCKKSPWRWWSSCDAPSSLTPAGRDPPPEASVVLAIPAPDHVMRLTTKLDSPVPGGDDDAGDMMREMAMCGPHAASTSPTN
jgi:hypothetical protein